uniref:Uncharacterized protein n=1 Tax=Caulobacter phage BL57 TaxID=3348355 RepID=A0AB74UKB4_9VIRU
MPDMLIGDPNAERTIQVLALHQDEFDAFVPTPEQQAAIAAGDLIIGLIRYATAPPAE